MTDYTDEEEMSRSERFELAEALDREKKTSRRLRKLLRKASGPMSRGHWPSPS